MKKGVVLLITLFFITAISALVLKNLDDTDKFLEKQNHILNNTQILISIKNSQTEVSEMISKYKEEIDKLLEDDSIITFPLNIEELLISFTLKSYNKIDINKVKEEESTAVQDLFSENDIFDYSLFVDIYKEELKIEELQESDTKDISVVTNKQLDAIIYSFIIRSENQKIEQIRDDLGFISGNGLYELNVNLEYLGTNSIAYYILNEKGEVLYFDISFI